MSDELAHSELGPSGASGWRRCPGKIKAERGRPDNAKREAAEGTVFHDFAALCLITGFEPDDFPEENYEIDGHEITYDQEMRDEMHAGLDWIRDQLEPGDLIYIEKRVDISPWTIPGQFGTSDVLIVKVAKRKVIVFDWKYGKGVPVSPVENDQCYLYFLGCWFTFKLAQLFKGVPLEDIEVQFRIEQPRCAGGGGDWFITVAEAMEEGEKIKVDALATQDPHAPRIPGDKQCLFCKASGDCKEQAAYLLQVFGQKFSDIEEAILCDEGPTFEDPHKFSPEMRSWILIHWKAFRKYADDIHRIVLHEFKSGRRVPLLKAVEGRKGHRKYDPDSEPLAAAFLTRALGKDAYEPAALISPAKAEDALGKKTYAEKIASYVTQAEAKPILVPLTDKREPIQDFASKFGDLDDDDDTTEDDD